MAKGSFDRTLPGQTLCVIPQISLLLELPMKSISPRVPKGKTVDKNQRTLPKPCVN